MFGKLDSCCLGIVSISVLPSNKIKVLCVALELVLRFFLYLVCGVTYAAGVIDFTLLRFTLRFRFLESL